MNISELQNIQRIASSANSAWDRADAAWRAGSEYWDSDKVNNLAHKAAEAQRAADAAWDEANRSGAEATPGYDPLAGL